MLNKFLWLHKATESDKAREQGKKSPVQDTPKKTDRNFAYFA